jgi:hypothetical protein
MPRTKDQIADDIHAQCEKLTALAAEAKDAGMVLDFNVKFNGVKLPVTIEATISEPPAPPHVYAKKQKDKVPPMVVAEATLADAVEAPAETGIAAVEEQPKE